MSNNGNKIDYSKYSVLMSVYVKDNPAWFKEAVECMINQTLTPSEIVIVKDGPLTEELDGVIDTLVAENSNINFNIVPLEKNMGLGLALNRGVLECHNELIARMDSDDYSVPQRCELQLKLMEQEDVDIIGANIDEFIGTIQNVTAHRVFPEQHEDIINFSKKRTPFAHPAVIMKKSQLLEAGNYQHCYLAEDYDIFVRLLQLGCKARSMSDVLVYVRVSEDFYSRRGGIKYLKALLAFNKKLYRQHWFGFKDYFVRSAANITMCLIPNCMRSLIYKKLLRK